MALVEGRNRRWLRAQSLNSLTVSIAHFPSLELTVSVVLHVWRLYGSQPPNNGERVLGFIGRDWIHHKWLSDCSDFAILGLNRLIRYCFWSRHRRDKVILASFGVAKDCCFSNHISILEMFTILIPSFNDPRKCDAAYFSRC